MGIYTKIVDMLTNNKKEIPLLSITFNLEKYRETMDGSCDIKLHPSLKDEVVIEKINELIDCIRENIDMDELV